MVSSFSAFTALSLSFASLGLAHFDASHRMQGRHHQQHNNNNPVARHLDNNNNINHSNKRHAAYLAARQAAPTAPAPAPIAAASSSTFSPTFAIPTPTSVSGISVPPMTQISSGMPTVTPATLFTTFTPGATPPVSGAVPLPTINIVPTAYPPLDVVPPTNSTQLAHWMSALASANIPDIAPTVDGTCASDPQLIPNAGSNGTCWWTCGGCVRPTDISSCPQKDTWGVSYDDGPSDYTAKLLNFLNDEELKATFFVVGSRAISRPNIVQAEYMLGHSVSVHTWSHPPLTSLTNAEIVAELGWTMIAIKAILGVTPSTMRPPYGDIDDRVRAICKLMGLTPIIWTGYGETEYDTDDWQIPAGTTTAVQSYSAFLQILTTAVDLTTGFIVLEHDLYQQTVDMAVGYFLPLAISKKFTLQPIHECLNEPLSQFYIETSTNSTTVPPPGTNTLSASQPSGTGKSPISVSVSSKSGLPTGSGTAQAGQATQSAGAMRRCRGVSASVEGGLWMRAGDVLALGVFAGVGVWYARGFF